MASSAIDRLVDDVVAWSRERDCPVPATWVEGDGLEHCLWQLLDARRRWLGCIHPFRWKSGDAHRLLVETAAPRLVDRHGLAEHGATALRLLFDYLDEADRFHPGTARTDTLRRELDRAAPKFAAAMADPDGWRLAKRVFTAMLADGVEAEDKPAVWDWTAEFNEARQERRRAVFGPLLQRQPELAADASTSLLIGMLVTLGKWAGDGRKMSKKGILPPAELESLAEWMPHDFGEVRALREDSGLTRWWRIAIETDVLRLSRTHVRKGPRYAVARQVRSGEADPSTALEFWTELFDELVEPDRGAPEDTVDGEAREWGPLVMGELYRANGAMSLDELAESVSSKDAGGPVDPTYHDLEGKLTRSEVGILLVNAAEHRVVAVEPGDEVMTVSPAETSVALTPIGRCAVRQKLLGAGADAPLAETEPR